MKTRLFITCMLMGTLSSMAQKTAYKEDVVILYEKFSTQLDSNLWVIEQPGLATDKITIDSGRLLLDTYGGVTVWLKTMLSGNYRIRYKRKIVMGGGDHDRLSDCNVFWMATDPTGKMFKRKGAFPEYDSMQLYYVGMGGNYNTSTRFRKYDGTGNKPIISEFLDARHLLLPNKEYEFEILVLDGFTSFSVDGELYFSFRDPAPLPAGWFGFRSTRSRQWIDDLEIIRITAGN